MSGQLYCQTCSPWYLVHIYYLLCSRITISKKLKLRVPSKSDLLQAKSISWLKKYFYLNEIWSYKQGPIARATAIGLFCALLPIPFQMAIAAPASIYFLANLPIAIALVWITNPITMPFILYLQYKLGAYILGLEAIEITLSIDAASKIMHLIWRPLVLGSVVSAIIFSIVGYVAVNLYLNQSNKEK